jgi:hypothetical protein
VLKVPPDDYYRIVHVLPSHRFVHTPSFLGLTYSEDFILLELTFIAGRPKEHRFVHTPSFLGLTYSEDFILLELTFIAGRPKETRLALLKELNDRIVAATGISPDDLSVLIYELPGENISFGRGLAQRAHISAQS